LPRPAHNSPRRQALDERHEDSRNAAATEREESTMNGRMILAAMAATMLYATNALAVEKCSAKVDKKSGLLAVSGSAVTGTLMHDLPR